MKLKILGIAQDGGVPQINCHCRNCSQLKKTNKRLFATSFLVKINPTFNLLIDASPDLRYQINFKEFNNIKAIILSHAHAGHFLGLFHFGFEVSNKKGVSVFVSKKMASFLTHNQPWKQMVDKQNLSLKIFKSGQGFVLQNLKIRPLKVPHRDELTDTYGFIIKNQKKILIITDISKWQHWNNSLPNLIKEVDLAFIDGTFFDRKELLHRNINKIGHPMIKETMKLLQPLKIAEKNKIHFIHLNHSNPVISVKKTKNIIRKMRFKIAQQSQIFNM